MIDLMEIGRRLWEGDEPPTVMEASPKGRQAVDLMELGGEALDIPAGDPQALRESANFRNASASGKPHPPGFSANPQNPQPPRPAPAHEAEAIITALTRDVGRDLGLPLVTWLREVLAPMGRPERASLAAAIDDAFEAAQGPREARQEVAKLLDAHTPRQAHRDDLAGRPAWIEWIADRCPLVHEDRAFVCKRLKTLPPKAVERAARRYVETWQAAAAAESREAAKENRGRTEANRTLLALVK
ncbi:hypothetical protein HALO32_02853 [Halomonas lysinitropha]|uniref:Uncharacterized protein n=1 Tax=Halomonas lysinitropha TaxID=2607506 RepID=A0A5K1I5N3_9GAMM|nr:hypothetical protein [Halomonas lysinitropha]VVZ96746.1 hypothetical protein HALO32_02853 [Halomonas lysinitropha]